jgi:hypothetical protein
MTYHEYDVNGDGAVDIDDLTYHLEKAAYHKRIAEAIAQSIADATPLPPSLKTMTLVS